MQRTKSTNRWYKYIHAHTSNTHTNEASRPPRQTNAPPLYICKVRVILVLANYKNFVFHSIGSHTHVELSDVKVKYENLHTHTPHTNSVFCFAGCELDTKFAWTAFWSNNLQKPCKTSICFAILCVRIVCGLLFPSDLFQSVVVSLVPCEQFDAIVRRRARVLHWMYAFVN